MEDSASTHHVTPQPPVTYTQELTSSLRTHTSAATVARSTGSCGPLLRIVPLVLLDLCTSWMDSVRVGDAGCY